MSKNSLKSLSATEQGMDSLLGAATGLELADGDADFLKNYSERVAAEADESDNKQEQEELRREKQKELKKHKALHSVKNEDSVEHARMMADKQLKQMQRGVEEAEENAKRKNDNLKLGIKGSSQHATFGAKKAKTKKAPKKAAKLDVEKISDMAEKLHVELSDEDIGKFTTDDSAQAIVF